MGILQNGHRAIARPPFPASSNDWPSDRISGARQPPQVNSVFDPVMSFMVTAEPGAARHQHHCDQDRNWQAIDRLDRKLSDVADLFERLTFRPIQVHTTSIGELTPMHVGIMGTMAQMTLADLREKTRRGQPGRARAGRIPGGLALGCAVVPPLLGAQEAGAHTISSTRPRLSAASSRCSPPATPPARSPTAATRRASQPRRPALERDHDPRPTRPRHRAAE